MSDGGAGLASARPLAPGGGLRSPKSGPPRVAVVRRRSPLVVRRSNDLTTARPHTSTSARRFITHANATHLMGPLTADRVLSPPWLRLAAARCPAPCIVCWKLEEEAPCIVCWKRNDVRAVQCERSVEMEDQPSLDQLPIRHKYEINVRNNYSTQHTISNV